MIQITTSNMWKDQTIEYVCLFHLNVAVDKAPDHQGAKRLTMSVALGGFMVAVLFYA